MLNYRGLSQISWEQLIMEQAKGFMSSIVKGDSNAYRMIKQSMRQTTAKYRS